MLDAEGIDAVVLYTTVGLLWEAELDDAELSQAYTRAYNRWICEFCADSDRLVADRAPVAERSGRGGARARARGRRRRARRVRRAVHPRRPPARSSRQRSGVRGRAGSRRAVRDPPDVRAAVDEGRAHGHVGARQAAAAARRRCTASDGVRQQFTTLFDYGVFDKFPRLKVLVLESGGGWIGYWLDRIDAVYGHTFIGTRVPLEHKPSDYFRERCWISCDPDERTIPALVERFGDRFMWASDFPHADHTPEYVDGPRRARRRVRRRRAAARSSATTPARCSASTPDPPTRRSRSCTTRSSTTSTTRSPRSRSTGPTALNGWTQQMGAEVRHAVARAERRPRGRRHRHHRRGPGVLRRRRPRQPRLDRRRRRRRHAGGRPQRRVARADARRLLAASTPTCSARRSR